MPRAYLDSFPLLNPTATKELGWLTIHAALIFSARERQIRESKDRSPYTPNETLSVNFKDSLFTLVVASTSIQVPRQQVFAINHPEAGGIHVLIFVDALKLDLANRTVILDVAILPVTSAIAVQERNTLASLNMGGICVVKVDDAELKLWKRALPSFVERCRNWNHVPTCEYLTNLCPPHIAAGEFILCGCGNGKFPSNYLANQSHFRRLAKYCSRAAISPVFPFPYIDGIDVKDVKDLRVDRPGCRFCGRETKQDGGALLVCSRCMGVKYCSAECQKKDWKKHKATCRA